MTTDKIIQGNRIVDGISIIERNRVVAETSLTMIELKAQTHVTVNGIKLPLHFRVIRGYAEHQSAHLISVSPIKQGGFQSSVGFWTMLPAVSVRVMLDQDKEQTYTVARNDDGIVSPWIEGLDPQDQIEVSTIA